MPSIVARLERASEQADLDAVDLARVFGCSPRTVSRWLREGAEPRRQARERILEALVVLERLSSIMGHQAARDWLFTPVQLLDYEKPVDLLREGQFRRVAGVIESLAEGVFF